MNRITGSLLLCLSLVACGSKQPAPAVAAPPPPPPPVAQTEAAPPLAPPDAGIVGPADSGASATSAEKDAYERARPVFEKYCASCHTTRGTKATKKKLSHFSMDSYPFGGHHADEIGDEVREVLGAAGDKATMPRDKPGAVKGAELDLILAWAKAWDRAHADGEHEGHDH